MKKQEINFFSHYRNAFNFLENDSRVKSNHISMYLALFRQWNQSLFPRRMQILRDTMMKSTKIGNKDTYTQVLHDLHYYGYINYIFNPILRRSYVEIIPFDNGIAAPNNTPKNRTDKKLRKKIKSGTEEFNSDTIKFESGTNDEYKSGTKTVSEMGHIIKKETFKEENLKKTSSEVTNGSFKKTEEYFGNALSHN